MDRVPNRNCTGTPDVNVTVDVNGPAYMRFPPTAASKIAMPPVGGVTVPQPMPPGVGKAIVTAFEQDSVDVAGKLAAVVATLARA